MSITLSQSKASYLAQVAEGLADLPAEDREEVIQDLEAHLAELPDHSIEDMLGSPEAFVSEFRQSAGLTQTDQPSPGPLVRARSHFDTWASLLRDAVHWPSTRPFWIWIRGWVLITAWSLLYFQDPFTNFPIPRLKSSSVTGLILVVAATWLSIWLERRRGSDRPRRISSAGSLMFSAAAGLGLAATLVSTPTHHVEPPEEIYFEGLLTSDGKLVPNIYAYDLGGNPVEVLLFDQGGRPLLSLPAYVYEEAEYPGEDLDYGNGLVTFERDQFGRIIPNLYPLQLSTYDGYGRLVPMPPPSLGFPDMETEEQTDTGGVPTTTIPGV